MIAHVTIASEHCLLKNFGYRYRFSKEGKEVSCWMSDGRPTPHGCCSQAPHIALVRHVSALEPHAEPVNPAETRRSLVGNSLETPLERQPM